MLIGEVRIDPMIVSRLRIVVIHCSGITAPTTGLQIL
jgi:hypothetical protein